MPSGPVFPTNHHLGTLRGPPATSYESIPGSNRQTTAPIGKKNKNIINRVLFKR